MTTTMTWLAAPTGSPAQGGVDARAALTGGVAVRMRVRDEVCRIAAVEAAQGSGLPTSGAMTGAVAGVPQARKALLGVPVLGTGTALFDADHQSYIQNNGTTLGYLSSRRPSS